MFRLKKVSILISIIFMLSADFVYAAPLFGNSFWRRPRPSYNVTVSGKVEDSATHKAIAGAEIVFGGKAPVIVASPLYTDEKGLYRFDVYPSSPVSLVKITVKAPGYRQEFRQVLVYRHNRPTAITQNFKLRDIVKPSLTIYSPKEADTISTTPVIELRFSDAGSGINYGAIKIYVNGTVVKSWDSIDMNSQKAVFVVSEERPLNKGSAIISAQVRDLAGNISIKTVGVTVVSEVEELLKSGKEALLNKDILSANNYFEQAVGLTPTNPEANFYSALTGLSALPQNEVILTLLQDMGFKGPGGVTLTKEHLANPFNLTTIELPVNIERFEFTTPYPETGEYQELVRNTIIPELDKLLAGLDITLKSKGFVSYLEIANPIMGGARIEVDYADAAMLNSLICMAKAKAYQFLVRNLNVDLVELSQLFTANSLTPEYILQQYPELLRVNDAQSSINARDAYVQSIDSMLEAIDSIAKETDEQSDDPQG